MTTEQVKFLGQTLAKLVVETIVVTLVTRNEGVGGVVYYEIV